MNNCGCKRPAFGPEPHAPVPLHGGGFVPNAIEWLKKKIDKLFGTAVFTVNGHEPEGGNVDVFVPSKVSELENDAGYLTEHQDVSGIASTAEAALSVATDAAENSVRIVNGKAPTAGSVKIVLDDLADKDGNIETTKTIMVSRDGGESPVALYSDLINVIDAHNNDEVAHTKLMATVARDYATKTEVDAKADKSALQAEVDRAQAAEAQLTTKAANAQSAANVAQSSADAAQNTADVASDKADAVYAALENKLDKTIPTYNGNLASLTADGNLADSGKNASDFLPASSSYVGTWDVYDTTTFRGDFSVGPSGELLGITSSHGSLYKFGDNRWYYGESQDPASEIAVKGDISELESSKADRASLAPEYSATSAYSIGAIVYHDGNIYQCKTAIAAGGEAWNAAHWELRKLHDFFTESNSLLTATIDARLPYPLYAVPSTGLLKDRAINTTSLASVTVPDNFTDLLIRASVASSIAVTMPDATTKYGDTFPGETGEYLITITKTGASEAYVRTIKLEVANA